MRHASAMVGLMVCAAALGSCASSAPATAAAAAALGTGDERVAVNGAALRVRALGEGDGLPVVFVHGYGSRLEAWRLVQPALAEARRTVSFDQRGFGLSERTRSGYGTTEHAADLIALLDALHLKRVVLVGHSYGAGVVLRAALEHPERVAGVVLVSPFALDEQMNATLCWARVPLVGEWMFATSFRGFAGEKLQLAFADGARFASLAAMDEVEALQAIEGTDRAALATVLGMHYGDVEGRYASLAMPVRVVWGEADRVTPIRSSRLFAEHLPQATVLRVPGVGHMPPWEAPAAVIDAIHAVLAQAATTATIDAPSANGSAP